MGNNDPLIVVDGMPLTGGLNQINMNDVESMQILKDASSTAIYGARGANGVVIISTKRGSIGKSALTFDVSSATSEATNMVHVLNASQFASLHNDILNNAGLSPNPDFQNPSSLGKGTDWVNAYLMPDFKTIIRWLIPQVMKNLKYILQLTFLIKKELF